MKLKCKNELVSQLNYNSFFSRRVLQITSGMSDLGGMQWELVGTLVLGWFIVYGIIWKGLHSSGKIIWFTALFPYFVMFILLGRALTLPGAWDGLSYYVRIDWDKIFLGKTWIAGATQIFFAYSVGMGALPALGSYNKFHHDCYKCVYECLRSICGERVNLIRIICGQVRGCSV